jgi:hypothetical protein
MAKSKMSVAERTARRIEIEVQSEQIAALLDIDPEAIACDFDYGVCLTRVQAAALIALATAHSE